MQSEKKHNEPNFALVFLKTLIYGAEIFNIIDRYLLRYLSYGHLPWTHTHTHTHAQFRHTHKKLALKLLLLFQTNVDNALTLND